VAEATLEGESVAARLAVRRFKARCHRDAEHLVLWVGAEEYELRLDDPRTQEFAASAASGGLTTPLPGVVVAVPVSVGQQVAAGDALMVIEAMKMEHTIAAPYAGTVISIHFARGERVPEGRALLELKRAEG
jgi:3-methylcrotonyl-CoA carboxylase alpha subunit